MEAAAMEVSRLWLVFIGFGSYLFLRTVYRLYFHPLSGIPGPKLTAATHLYEFYHTIIRQGMFMFEVEKMHQKYGPIVRINPREVHISDPEFYNEIYAAGSRKRDKDPEFVTSFGAPESMIATLSHDQHRFRRNLLNNFFSKNSVLQASDILEERLAKLVLRLKGFQLEDSVVRLHDLFAALTSDAICAYACGRDWGFLDDPDFCNDIRISTGESVAMAHVNRYFPFILHTMRLFSFRTLSVVFPGKASLFQFLASLYDYSVAAFKEEATSPKTNVCPNSKKNMVNALMDPTIPPKERTQVRLIDELMILISAATETTTTALVFAAFQLGWDTAIRDRLREELKQVMPTSDSRPTWPELEKLPYLNAFINEVLRLSYGTVGRLPRIAPMESLQYKQYIIPPGTPMSSSTYLLHRNPATFPDPEKFSPDRWIEAAENGQHLTRYLTSFSRGSRSCIGINFAQMELSLTIAHLARWFNIQLHDTEPEDLIVASEMFVPFTRRGPMMAYAKTTFVGE